MMFANEYDALRVHQGDIVLFGALAAGVQAKRIIERIGLKASCFCDNNAALWGTQVDGLRVVSPSELRQTYADAKIFVCSYNRSTFIAIQKQLGELGFRDVQSDDSLMWAYKTQFRRHKLEPAQADYLLDCVRNPAGRLVIDHLGLILTTKCTLRCKECGSLIPRFATPTHDVLDRITTALDAFVDCVDAINTLFLFGGEPFIYPEFGAIVEKVLEYKNIRQVTVVTNGTVTPKDDWVPAIKELDFRIIFSNYGDLSTKKEQLYAFCAQHHVIVEESVNTVDDVWHEIGDLSKLDKPASERERAFATCKYKSSSGFCTMLINGQFHLCATSGFGSACGAIPKLQEDYVDMLDVQHTIQEKRNKIDLLYHKAKSIGACDYCTHAYHKAYVKPAEQC